MSENKDMAPEIPLSVPDQRGPPMTLVRLGLL